MLNIEAHLVLLVVPICHMRYIFIFLTRHLFHIVEGIESLFTFTVCKLCLLIWLCICCIYLNYEYILPHCFHWHSYFYWYLEKGAYYGTTVLSCCVIATLCITIYHFVFSKFSWECSGRTTSCGRHWSVFWLCQGRPGASTQHGHEHRLEPLLQEWQKINGELFDQQQGSMCVEMCRGVVMYPWTTEVCPDSSAQCDVVVKSLRFHRGLGVALLFLFLPDGLAAVRHPAAPDGAGSCWPRRRRHRRPAAASGSRSWCRVVCDALQPGTDIGAALLRRVCPFPAHEAEAEGVASQLWRDRDPVVAPGLIRSVPFGLLTLGRRWQLVSRVMRRIMGLSPVCVFVARKPTLCTSSTPIFTDPRCESAWLASSGQKKISSHSVG